ncbi:MAG: hypothetical protein KBD83_03615 [Gammaproteobacteria bacterium]|nr:hypothetical protein [Gammaproteobacteria bacterium]
MKISQALLHKKEIAWTECEDGYKMRVIDRQYGDVKQRWALMKKILTNGNLNGLSIAR